MLKMMTSLWIIIVLISTTQLAERVMGDYHCTMKSFEVTCTGINAEQLPQDMAVTLNKIDISTLNITNGLIPTISPITFREFINLQSLYITDSGVANLEDNAFSKAADLQDLSLSNNALTEFNLRSLSPENALRTLDISYNCLNDFSGFNVTYFPRLTMLNLAGNFLTFLPISILKLLEDQNEFYLVADNNPWNCSHPNWSQYLTDKLVDAFCTNKTFPSQPRRETAASTVKSDDKNISEASAQAVTEITRITDINQLLIEFNENSTTLTEPERSPERFGKTNCIKCSFYYCLWWLFCGIWIGIIIGNIAKIRTLLCVAPVTYADEYTQCEYSLMDQHTLPGIYASRSYRRGSALGAPVQAKPKIIKLEIHPH